ncbi:hypothetical protein DAPPUDRAFT_322565 [Daphnia pulex]|uniref:Uncharacterized protein n=1 Tax=Daphnia pulex TaxID=6669 RepID=E9GWD8_DAPPU|nr:hypothetical protein DAPPUDRAFT_322565 [Daphnia pulex]|eukprot:EFX76205.1 hypothetical protein DAPPUDRAFT_322565 [Daphnia pulex]
MPFSEDDIGFPDRFRTIVECKGCKNWTCLREIGHGRYRPGWPRVWSSSAVCFFNAAERSETPSGLKHITKRRGWKAAYCHLGLKTVKTVYKELVGILKS